MSSFCSGNHPGSVADASRGLETAESGAHVRHEHEQRAADRGSYRT
jgi:hypothetical protein